MTPPAPTTAPFRVGVSKPTGEDYKRFLPYVVVTLIVFGGLFLIAATNIDRILFWLTEPEIITDDPVEHRIVTQVYLLGILSVPVVVAILALAWVLTLVPRAVEIHPDHIAIVTYLRRRKVPFADLKGVRPISAEEFRQAPLLSRSTVALTAGAAGGIRLERRSGATYLIGIAAPNAFLSKSAAAVEAWSARHRKASAATPPSTS